MLKLILATVFSLSLLGCAGKMIGYESHVYDIPNVKVGDVWDLTYYRGVALRMRIYFLHAEDIIKECGKATKYMTDAMGCAIWREETDPKNKAYSWRGIGMPENIDCVVFTPPNEKIFDHEIRHCVEGVWH